MNTDQRRHVDHAHHHPRVRRLVKGRWVWECSCGGASCRTGSGPFPWRRAVLEALLHADLIDP